MFISFQTHLFKISASIVIFTFLNENGKEAGAVLEGTDGEESSFPAASNASWLRSAALQLQHLRLHNHIAQMHLHEIRTD